MTQEDTLEVLAALRYQHEAIDYLMARLILLDSNFLPSKSGPPWAALLLGLHAIKLLEDKTSRMAYAASTPERFDL